MTGEYSHIDEVVGVVRCRFDLRGRVQGVGFRPFVYRLAKAEELTGFVGNSPIGAFIEVQGQVAQIDRFIVQLRTQLPPVASISSIDQSNQPVIPESDFQIHTSSYAGRVEVDISPDMAMCDQCLNELNDSADRRYRYPFINCTHCGPRYSIIKTIPYDRCHTTMSVFQMCPACEREYHDPADRRFHAQPNACDVCGPHVWLADNAGMHMSDGCEAIAECAALLNAGRIIAIKGLGGFHLACRADRDEPVLALRARKGREAKPLAMMAASLPHAELIVQLDDLLRALLQSRQRPIVLAPRRAEAAVSEYVAPGSCCFGLMLSYTPMHQLLFEAGAGLLVMTSGNPSSEPLCADNNEAIERLKHIADAFLLHDRDIHRRVDDSVVMAMQFDRVADQSGEVVMPSYVVPLRRARGYVPEPIQLQYTSPEPVLALGGELKSTVCLLRGNKAVLSEHLGDLDNPASYRHFVESVSYLRELFDIEPAHVACDMHPAYLSTGYARSLDLPVIAVQHHHAHIVSCMSENALSGKVIGVACDGTGYGDDGSIWGCEVLVCDELNYERIGYLKPFQLPGGDAAAKSTWRPAVGLVHQHFGRDWPLEITRLFQHVDPDALGLVRQQLGSSHASVVRTSSLGRLFDAAAFILGLCTFNRYEAEAPILLEAIATKCHDTDLPRLDGHVQVSEDGVIHLDGGRLIAALVDQIGKSRSVPLLAKAFHDAVARMLAKAAIEAAGRVRLERIVLSGGCFANRLLTGQLWRLLTESGLQVYVHHLVPPGDGGISLGQAVIVAASLNQHGAS